MSNDTESSGGVSEDGHSCGRVISRYLSVSSGSIHEERFISQEIMRTTVFNYIECDYNRWRRHSACGGLSPEQFENQNLT